MKTDILCMNNYSDSAFRQWRIHIQDEAGAGELYAAGKCSRANDSVTSTREQEHH